MWDFLKLESHCPCSSEYFALLRCHRECFTNQFNLSVHLPACPPPTSFACANTHILILFFPIGDEKCRSHMRGSLRPLIRNISLFCLHLNQAVVWQQGNFLWAWADARDALRWYSFQVLPQQPIRSYIYYSWQAREARRDGRRWETSKWNFLLWIKSTTCAFTFCFLSFSVCDSWTPISSLSYFSV